MGRRMEGEDNVPQLGPRFRHAEAFNLMWYQCDAGLHRERIWNSRDGVTPFVIGCRFQGCGRQASHVDWHLDQRAPHHHLVAGERFFRDGRDQEAVQIMVDRFKAMEATAYAKPRETWQAEAERIAQDSHEFQRGWPMLVVAAGDGLVERGD